MNGKIVYVVKEVNSKTQIFLCSRLKSNLAAVCENILRFVKNPHKNKYLLKVNFHVEDFKELSAAV